MTDLTELEQQADREGRHGHRELVKRLEEENRELALQVITSQGQADEALGRAKRAEAEADGAHCVIAEERAEVLRLRARVAELEDAKIDAYWRGFIHAYDTAWNAAIRAAAEMADEYADEWGEPIDEDDFAQGAADEARAIAKNIRTLLRNEGDSDD